VDTTGRSSMQPRPTGELAHTHTGEVLIFSQVVRLERWVALVLLGDVVPIPRHVVVAVAEVGAVEVVDAVEEDAVEVEVAEGEVVGVVVDADSKC